MTPTIHTLSNGFRVVLIPMKDNHTVTTMMLVNTGSDFERDAEAGIAHFLEHMCFKGTKKRPTSKDIAVELERMGAHHNAFTDREMTGYYAKASSSDALRALEIILDIYINPTFPESEMEKEKGVVIEEIKMYEDKPEYRVWRVLLEGLYGNQPSGRMIIGSEKTVNATTQKDLITFHKKFYTPLQSTLIVSGGFDEKEILQYARKTLGNMVSAKKKVHTKTRIRKTGPTIVTDNKPTDQLHTLFGYHSVPLMHADIPALSVLSGILGGGMSSRLFIKIREELGAAYYVNSENDHSTDRGLFLISAGIAKERSYEVIGAIVSEISLLKEESVPIDELDKVKAYLIGSLHLALETSNSFANYYGPQLILKGVIQMPEKRAQEIRKVTPADIKRVARKYLNPENLVFAYSGNELDHKKLATLLGNAVR